MIDVMPAAAHEVSFIVIPDTQGLSNHHPELYGPLAEQVVAAREPWNVQMVLHVGDVVDRGDDDPEEYDRAAAGLGPIAAAGLPMLISSGNHDYDDQLASSRRLNLFRSQFAALVADDAVTFEPGGIENSWATISTPQGNLGFLSLEFAPRDEVLAWAADLLSRHPEHQVVVNTHAHLFIDGERTRPGCAHHPHDYVGTQDGNDGEQVWQKLLRHHGNVLAVFSGHHVWDHVAHRVDRTDVGQPVLQSFQNWQGAERNGEGRFRIVTVDLAARRLRSCVILPTTAEVDDREGYDLDIDLSA